MNTNSSLHARRQNAVPRGVANACSIYAERAANAELWDVEGRRYIDFAGGIAVLNTGHCHPTVVGRAREMVEGHHRRAQCRRAQHRSDRKVLVVVNAHGRDCDEARGCAKRKGSPGGRFPPR